MAETRQAAASLPGLWVEPERPTLAELAQLLADAEALGFLPHALWMVEHSPCGDLLRAFLPTFSEIGSTWAEVAVGLEQSAFLVRAESARERAALLTVGLPVERLVPALRVRQSFGSDVERVRAGELLARLAPPAPPAPAEQYALAIELARERE